MMLAWCLAVVLQDPFAKAAEDPEGVVLDERGKPIAGAVVELLGEFPSSPFSRSVHEVLARTPLPRATTDADGRFVLPLVAPQRSLGRWSGERRETFWLVASKPNARSWREPLTGGLRDFCGSRIVLPSLPVAAALEGMPWPPCIPPGTGAAGDIVARVGGNEVRALARTPLAPPAPTTRGPWKLHIRVQREGGAGLPHAWLRLSNPFLEAAAVAAARPQTDARGHFEVDEVPEAATSGELEVVGEHGEAFAVVTSRRTVHATQVRIEVTVVGVELRPCRTVDARGEVVPFAPLVVTRGGPGRFCTLLSDSVGRVILEGDPTSETFLGDPLHGRAGGVRSVGGVVEATVARRTSIALRTDAWSSLGYEYRSKQAGSMGSAGLRPLGGDCDRFFVWFLTGPGDALTLRSAPEIALQIRFEELEAHEYLGYPVARLDKRKASIR